MDSSELAIEIAKALRDEGLSIDFAYDDPDSFVVLLVEAAPLVVTVVGFGPQHERSFPYLPSPSLPKGRYE